MFGRSPESLPASGPQLPESLFACSFPNDNRLRSLPSPLFYYGQQLATYDNTIQLVLLFYYMNHWQSTHTFLIKLSGRRAVKRTIFRTWVHTTNYLARDFSITKLLSNRKMLIFLDKISLSVLWGSKLDLNLFDRWRTIYIGHTGCFYRQCPFPHLIQIKINKASFAFLHLLGNKDQQSALFKERQSYYHFPFPAVMHHQLWLLFTIIIAIWPTNQCLVSSLEDAGACRQSYITISSSYHSLPPVTDTGRNWEEGKYRNSSQSTFLQAKYMTFLKMMKEN